MFKRRSLAILLVSIDVDVFVEHLGESIALHILAAILRGAMSNEP